jgi:hypothetical protein
MLIKSGRKPIKHSVINTDDLLQVNKGVRKNGEILKCEFQLYKRGGISEERKKNG